MHKLGIDRFSVEQMPFFVQIQTINSFTVKLVEVSCLLEKNKGIEG